jgi:uncharacterized tellurite resistance protein B-like protein
MNFSDFITNHGKRVNKSSFIHLVQISKTDGKIQQDELEMLHKEGKKFGLTDPEIEKLIHSEKDHHYTPPYSLEEKFDHLYNLAGMVLADNVVKDSEKKMIKKFAIESGFEYSKLEELIKILFEGIKDEIDEEKLFVKFKNHLIQ